MKLLVMTEERYNSLAGGEQGCVRSYMTELDTDEMRKQSALRGATFSERFGYSNALSDIEARIKGAA